MRLIFIRHGEPDYRSDGLTEKGINDAKLLAERVKNWKVDKIYTSPLGRALQTAEPSLKALGMEATQIPWLREFSYPIHNPTHGRRSICWDFIPSDWADDPVMYTETDWLDYPPASQNPDIKVQFNATIEGFDELIAKHGYVRTGKYYINRKNPKNRKVTATVIDEHIHYANELPREDAGETILFFCHFGVTCLMLSRLINVPFCALTHGLIIPTSGIVVVNSEERWDDQVSFRIQAIGDVAHLLNAGESVSSAGSFAPLFQG